MFVCAAFIILYMTIQYFQYNVFKYSVLVSMKNNRVHHYIFINVYSSWMLLSTLKAVPSFTCNTK